MDNLKITFMHFGKDKCPHCGTIGNPVKSEICFLECPLCNTKYTNEIVLQHGDVDENALLENN